MISLEQIRLLEAKIIKAVELIRTLKAENTSLRKTLDSAQARMQDLEKLVGQLKTDQKEIEQSILRAIQNLDALEDEVSDSAGDPAGRAKRSSSPRSRAEKSLEAEDTTSPEDQSDSPAPRETEESSAPATGSAADAAESVHGPEESEEAATRSDTAGDDRELDIF
jgi:peptidoglycan hydrolase CwlO-like protein